ncbi:MAG: YHS domain protein [Phycisphaerales bacterium]|nr:YHS domain protein [Phycisphaerales bacterium]
MIAHRFFAGLAFGFFLLFAAPVRAQDAQKDVDASGAAAVTEPVRNIKEWNLPHSKAKLAIKGFDPVAYFPEGGGKAEKGSSKLSTEYKGVEYHFTSTEHRGMFLANPDRYEPAHGGWCSWAMITGDKTEPNPKSFIVKDDRLFLFYDGLFGDTKAQWLKTDHDTSAASADAQWKAISGESSRQVPEKEPAKPEKTPGG